MGFISNEGGMQGYELDISGNNTTATWLISNEGVEFDSGTTGKMSWVASNNELGFELFGSSFYNDLVFIGYRSGESNPYDIINASLEGNPIPIPSTIWLFTSFLIGLAGIRRKLRK